MLTIKQITENTEAVIRGLEKKHFKNAKETIEQVIALNDKRRSTQNQLDKNLAEVNSLSRTIGQLMKEGKKEEAETARARVAELKEGNKELDATMTQAATDMQNALYTIPNIPYDSVPEGVGAEDNVVEKMGGMETELPKDALPHWELAKKYDLIDFDLGVKITGAGFPVYKGKGAQLQRALINFFLDTHTSRGFKEWWPPIVVKRQTMFGTGQLPKFEDDAYHVSGDNFLIPTAEVVLTNLHAGEVLDADTLPRRYTAFTPCFREEAGSAGRDTRGIIRQHEFDKVEMVKFAKPEESDEELESMTAEAEYLLQQLGLPYRVISLCTGDLGFSARQTYDIEVWLPSYNAYKEISSCSNCGDFQARRANIKYRDPENFKGSRYLHTLNGSGLPAGRTMAAILENYQNADGTITIPEVLRPYMGGLEKIEPVA